MATKTSHKIAAGKYLVHDTFVVIRRGAAGLYEDGVSWYWHDQLTDHKSGYFSTKAECIENIEIRLVNGVAR